MQFPCQGGESAKIPAINGLDFQGVEGEQEIKLQEFPYRGIEEVVLPGFFVIAKSGNTFIGESGSLYIGSERNWCFTFSYNFCKILKC
jgi:hypothetical protein